MLLRTVLSALILMFFVGIVWVTADAYIIGFHLTSAGALVVHLCGLAFAGLFLFSFLSSRFKWAERIRLLFKLFNIAVAFVFYLLPMAVALSITLALGSFSTATSVTLSWMAIAVAAALGIIGVQQARGTIRVVRHTVSLKNAPAAWNGRTAVLVTDTHFGLVKNERFSRKVVKKIESLSPNFVLHGGDFYDGPIITMPPITAPWKALAARIPIFYTPGNHEMYGNFDAFVASVRDAGATALLDETTDYDGVQIAGIRYRSKSESAAAERAIAALSLDPARPAILINHPPTFHRAAVAAGVDLMVSGHTHDGQFWPINYIVRILYGRYTYGKHMVRGMAAITSRGVGTAGPPCRLFKPPEVVLITFTTA